MRIDGPTDRSGTFSGQGEDMLDCDRFLEEYSEFRDGFLGPEESEAFEAHLRVCRSCARYDHVVRRGAQIYRDLPELQVSEDFMPRLQHRIFHVEEEMKAPGHSASGIPASAVLSIAAALALAAWLPALREEPGLSALPAVAARPPQTAEPQLLVSAPLLTHHVLHRGHAPDGDPHLLFGYFPVAAPVAIRTALLD